MPSLWLQYSVILAINQIACKRLEFITTVLNRAVSNRFARHILSDLN